MGGVGRARMPINQGLACWLVIAVGGRFPRLLGLHCLRTRCQAHAGGRMFSFMTLEEVFPALARGGPENLRTYQLDYHDARTIAVLLGAARGVCSQARQISLDTLEATSLEIIDQAVAARDGAEDDAGRSVLDLVILQVATGMAATAAAIGELGRPHEWIIRAMTDGYTGDADYDFQWQRLLCWTWFPGPLRAIALGSVLGWLEVVFAQASRVGDLLTVAEQASPYVDVIFRDERARAVLPQEAIVSALTARADWAGHRGQHDLARSVATLRDLARDDSLTLELRAHIEAFFALSPLGLTDTPQAEQARAVIEEHAQHLRASDRLRLVVTSCDRDATLMRQRASEIEAAISDVRDERAEQADDAADLLFGEGRTFDAIGPLIRTFAEAGDVENLTRILRAWAGTTASAAAWQPLVGLSLHPVGTLWTVDGAVAPAANTEYVGHHELVMAMNAFLSTTVIDRDAEDIELASSARPGIPVPQQAPRFEAAALDHLHIDALRPLLEVHSYPDELVYIPSMTIPVSALLAHELNYAPALSVSFQRPATARPLQHVALLGGDTTTSELELKTVRSLLESRGIEVWEPHCSAERFRAAYADPQFDAIWVTTHGEFEHLRPDASVLIFGQDDQLDIGALAELQAPRGDRRLLMLNICDGAVSATLGGPQGFGIGPVLAGPTQSVVSNLWPIHPLVAASVGALLAKALIAHADHRAALAEVLSILRGGRISVLAHLEAMGECSEDLTERVRQQESVDFEGLASWGAPMLLV